MTHRYKFSHWYLILIMTLAFACQQINENNNVNESPTVLLALEIKSELGEGAFWSQNSGELYWVDILGRKVHIFNPSTGKNRSFNTPIEVGTVVPKNNTNAVIALANGVYIINTDSGYIDTLSLVENNLPATRLNDGKCDPQGRFWVGSMAYDLESPIGGLYRINSTGSVTKVLDSITISNGLVWDQDRNKMYYIDTPTGVIQSFNYDPNSGNLSNQRIAVTIPDSLGQPDGMTIDEKGKLWVGMWNGNSIARFDPESGELISRILVPAHNVTSCAFGGPDLDTLYITTAGIDMTEDEQNKYPLAGSIFKVVPGVKGVNGSYFGNSN